MDTSTNTLVVGVLRHALQLGAGVLVAHGSVTDGMAQEAIGGILSLLTVGWYLASRSRAAPPAP